MAKLPPGVSIPAFQRGNQWDGWSVISNHPIIVTQGLASRQSTTGRIELRPRAGVNAIALAVAFDARYTGVIGSAPNGESPFYNPYRLRCSYQPQGASVDQSSADLFYPYTFGGKRDVVMSGGMLVVSDPLQANLVGGVRAFNLTYANGGLLPVPAAPTAVATSGAGLSVGTQVVGYTIVYPDGLETPGSVATSVSTTSGNQQITVTSPSAANFPGAIGWRVWMSSQGTTTPLYDTSKGEIPFGTDSVISLAIPAVPASLTVLKRVLNGQVGQIALGGTTFGGTGPGSANNGEFNSQGRDLTGGGFFAASNVQAPTIGPAFVLAKDPAKVWDSVAVQGDSIDTGAGDQGFGGNFGGMIVRALLGQTANRAYDASIVPKMGFIHLSTVGESAQTYATGAGNLRRREAAFATMNWLGYSRNDVLANFTGAAIAASLVTIATQYPPGKKLFQRTCPPYTTSTDGFASLASQTFPSSSMEGNKRQVNNWIMSTSTTAVAGENLFRAQDLSAPYNTNFYSGGNAVAVRFLTARPFRTGTEAVRVGGVLKVLTTDYTYYGATTINGVQYASGVTLVAAPGNSVVVTADYTPIPLPATLLGSGFQAVDVCPAMEDATVPGLWKAAAELPLVTGTSSGGNSTAVFNDTSKAWTQDQYRSYVVRILTDTTTPAAAGQNGTIISNTATQLSVSGFTVTPSAAATYQIYDPYTADGIHPGTRAAMPGSVLVAAVVLDGIV